MSITNYDLVSPELSDIENSIVYCLKGMVWNSQTSVYCSEEEASHNVKYIKSLIEDYCEAYLRNVSENRTYLVEPDMKGMLEKMGCIFE